MIYTLSRLAPGSYDVLLNGKIVASLVRSGEKDYTTWTVELLTDLPPWRDPLPSQRQSTSSAAWRKSGSGLEARDPRCRRAGQDVRTLIS